MKPVKISKGCFVKALESIKQADELQDQINTVLRPWESFVEIQHPCIDALVNVLKEAMEDAGDCISWWLYEDVEHIIYWDHGSKECNVEDPEDLYDYLVEYGE